MFVELPDSGAFGISSVMSDNGPSTSLLYKYCYIKIKTDTVARQMFPKYDQDQRVESIHDLQYKECPQRSKRGIFFVTNRRAGLMLSISRVTNNTGFLDIRMPRGISYKPDGKSRSARQNMPSENIQNCVVSGK
jgi:hypothetical protein